MKYFIEIYLFWMFFFSGLCNFLILLFPFIFMHFSLLPFSLSFPSLILPPERRRRGKKEEKGGKKNESDQNKNNFDRVVS